MENQNQLATKPLTTKALFERVDVRKKFEEMLGKKAQGFMTSVLQIVASNEQLKKADPTTVYQAAATAATLDLPLNNNLGFAYIVPYNTKIKGENGEPDRWVTVGQFQMGYRGYKQLALRTSQFVRINATDVREGEIKSHNRLTGDIVFEWIEDEAERAKKKIVAYVSYFELVNGYKQTFLMYLSDMEKHAKRYSQTYKKGFGLWKDDFESMALKTVTKLNLSKNAPLSVELQNALITDQAVIKNAETNEVEYVDGEAEVVDKEDERVKLLIQEAKTTEDLFAVSEHLSTDEQKDLFEAKKGELFNTES